MRILALETSTREGSVAVLQGDRLVYQHLLDPAIRTTQTLHPAVEACLAAAGWTPQQVQLVAVADGPGSFTGLRIGITAAKTFAYAVGAEVVAVETLRIIAQQAADDLPPGDVALLSTVLDAQRGQLFAAWFRRQSNGQLATVQPAEILDDRRWLDRLELPTRVAGLGLLKGGGYLLRSLPEGVLAADPATFAPRASTVGRLAATDYAAGVRTNLWTLAPRYLRKAAAEEKWEQRHGRQTTSVEHRNVGP